MLLFGYLICIDYQLIGLHMRSALLLNGLAINKILSWYYFFCLVTLSQSLLGSFWSYALMQLSRLMLNNY